MLVDEALVSHLLSKTAITSIVSSRVYGMIAPQDAPYPHITINQISGERVRSMEGSSGLNRAVFNVHVWAKKPLEAKTLSDKVRLVVDGFKGLMGGVSGVYIGACFVEDDIDLYDDQALCHHVVRKLVVWHREVKPNGSFT
jgi:hypothetical protein